MTITVYNIDLHVRASHGLDRTDSYPIAAPS